MSNSYIKGDIVMNIKDLPKISNYIDIHLSPVRNLHVTVEVLDSNDNTIEVIHGLSTGGNLSISNESLIRRTGNLSFILYDYLLPNKKDSLLWMTNKIRIYAGLEDLSSVDNSIVHFCLGTFYITEPSINIGKDNRSVDVVLEDYMTRWEQEELDVKLVLEANTPLNTAVDSIMNSLGETNTNIEFTDLKIPHKLEFEAGTNILDVLTQLRDLYMDWECFYTTDGTFVFRRMKIQKENGEPIAWSFSNNSDLITDFQESFTYKNIKNKIIVIGGMNELTGVTPRAECFITNEDNPFHEKEIGLRKKVVVESTYSNDEQCKSKARYELFKSSNFQEQLEIKTIPIYYLDGNNVIEVENKATGNMELYVIDSIEIGLGIEDEMSISCHKMYFDEPDNSLTALEKFRDSIEKIIDGISNKGWLYLAEERIKDYYGIEGNGSDLIVKFEYQGLHGTTAYVTGYSNTKTQTLTIDIADYINVSGDSGDNGQGKEEYADRVFGHEMVHAVINNDIGVIKTASMQNWFKEGVAEYIHGADERLKKDIVENGSISTSKLNDLITTATSLLNDGEWKSESKYYSMSYVIIKYLDSKLRQNSKTMKDLFYSIKQSESNGDVAVKNAIVSNTQFSTFSDFVNNFSQNAYNFVRYNMVLDIGKDEEDTGSIAGSDNGSQKLNAENVFDNSKAIMGKPSLGFNVIFSGISTD